MLYVSILEYFDTLFQCTGTEKVAHSARGEYRRGVQSQPYEKLKNAGIS